MSHRRRASSSATSATYRIGSGLRKVFGSTLQTCPPPTAARTSSWRRWPTTLEHHYRKLLETNSAATHEELLREYWSEWQQQSLPVRFSKEDQAGSFDELAKRMLSAFAQSELAKPAGEILAIEESLRGEIIPGLPDLLGKVDLILETPTELIVSDWKSAPDVSVLAQR